ncbi:MAG: diguanylate cyclase [Eubacteriales bacterium]|nr:diguanylate cyclase [Eubacteriales bacterium]
MKHFFAKIQKFSVRSKEYFSNCQDMIADSNKKTLRFCTKFFLLFMVMYGVFTFYLFTNPTLTYFYLIFIAGDIALMAFAARCFSNENIKFKTIQRACMFFVILVLSFTICISVFPFPDRPGIFYPIVYMSVSILFYFSFGSISLVLGTASIIYLVLVTCFKTLESASYDYFCCITACLLNCFFLFVFVDLRLQNGEVVQNLKHLSRTDPLTGLLNRRGAEGILSRNFRLCQNKQMPCTVIMMDIDNFKRYNDTFGHLAGDNCLKAFGSMLLSYAQDIGVTAVRFGGEEFLLLLPNCPLENAKTTAKALLSYIRARRIPSTDGYVTASIGVAVQVPDMTDTLENLIHQADSMLYRAKNSGKNRAVVASLNKEKDMESDIIVLKQQ